MILSSLRQDQSDLASSVHDVVKIGLMTLLGGQKSFLLTGKVTFSVNITAVMSEP